MASIPSRKHFSDVNQLGSYNSRLPVLAELLTNVCLKNDKLQVKSRSIFDGPKLAQVSIKDYLIRMCKYGHCSPPVFMCMAIYIDRFCERTGVQLNSSNIHRILLAAFLIAAKLNDDVYYSNKYYASIGGLALRETNELEAIFLEQTDWDMYVNDSEYQAYMSDLRETSSNHAAGTPVYALRRVSKREGTPSSQTKKPFSVLSSRSKTSLTEGGTDESLPRTHSSASDMSQFISRANSEGISTGRRSSLNLTDGSISRNASANQLKDSKKPSMGRLLPMSKSCSQQQPAPQQRSGGFAQKLIVQTSNQDSPRGVKKSEDAKPVLPTPAASTTDGPSEAVKPAEQSEAQVAAPVVLDNVAVGSPKNAADIKNASQAANNNNNSSTNQSNPSADVAASDAKPSAEPQQTVQITATPTKESVQPKTASGESQSRETAAKHVPTFSQPAGAIHPNTDDLQKAAA